MMDFWVSVLRQKVKPVVFSAEIILGIAVGEKLLCQAFLLSVK